ncbi:erythromycin esterase [Caulobacter sp. Root1455]|uniref:erythromycin esterase family protein n=1 Tax=Caulobacter sp. Root1455 TaxID=1736465 RepID=UPI0006FE8A50|nr:erythromycin esterase family protein [Caulobacter sp. Root1455]KQY95121.1 erythromycin esterase [Caulobacter sp. Root1455]
MTSPLDAPLFVDRADAGRRLAARLAGLGLQHPVVYALPRGGVPVAVEIAKVLAAPIDLILVRKLGAPGHAELAVGAVVDGEEAQTVINEEVARMTGADAAFLRDARRRELDEIERRRALYLGDHPRISPVGRTAIVVDDGLATGATAKVALRALRRQGAARIVLAIPLAPSETLEAMRAEADEVVCLATPRPFHGVGAFYGDFHQLTDDETVALLRQAWEASPPRGTGDVERRKVSLAPLGLSGDLQVPDGARGIVVFAHGSGSSRLSPRNRAVADALNAGGMATLLFDLLGETEAADRRKVFDIDLLAERLVQATTWIAAQPDLSRLPLGLFGASTGAAAALVAAAKLGERVRAVVSRGGRPDLAGAALARVSAPTLLIVGGADHQVIELNRQALARLPGDKALRIVPGAGHLFEEAGTLEQVMHLAGDWFRAKLCVPPPPGSATAPRAVAVTAQTRLAAAAEPLPDIDDPAFAAAFDRYGEARVVLLGEASHGTSEFYRARTAITRRLIEQHGFEIVAVEADWPDAAAIDRHVRLKPHREMTPPPFTRFPTWMWRNTDVDAFTRWLRAYNGELSAGDRVAFHGLDLYNMRASMAEVLAYLDGVDPLTAAEARDRYACMAPWNNAPAGYGRAALSEGYAICEREVVSILVDLVRKAADYAAQDGESLFDATQNARLVVDAERYYRAMYHGAHESWNLRDRHMFETLDRVLKMLGPGAKAVVWAHNSHIGDARYTEMGAARGELNIGQLCRERFGSNAALIGLGTHSGTVMAASDWDAPAEVKTVRPSRSDSYEALFHEVGVERFLVDLRPGRNEALRADLREPRLERYIGVVYRPDSERLSHYAHASLPEQYDAFVWFDRTRAVTPLATEVRAGEDETYPFGL